MCCRCHPWRQISKVMFRWKFLTQSPGVPPVPSIHEVRRRGCRILGAKAAPTEPRSHLLWGSFENPAEKPRACRSSKPSSRRVQEAFGRFQHLLLKASLWKIWPNIELLALILG